MLSGIYERLAKLFGPDAVVAFLARFIPDLVVAMITLVVFYLLWRLAARGLRAVLNRARLDDTAASFVLTGVKVLLASVAIVTALAQMGVNTASLLTSLGVAGLTRSRPTGA